MRKLKYYIYFIFCLLFFLDCSNKPPKIYHLQDTNNKNCYVYDGFKDDEKHIKYLFNFVKQREGYFVIVTNKNAVKFEDEDAFFNYNNSDVFSIRNVKYKYEFISLRPVIRLKETFFSKEVMLKSYTTQFTSEYTNININVLQNFINLCYDQEVIQKHKSYTYELYNKNKVKKVVINYHNYGEWFEIDIL